jgi:hypothetical protein
MTTLHTNSWYRLNQFQRVETWSVVIQLVGPLSLKDPIISLPNPASFSRRKVLLKMTFDYHNEVKKKMIITLKGKRQHEHQKQNNNFLQNINPFIIFEIQFNHFSFFFKPGLLLLIRLSR